METVALVGKMPGLEVLQRMLRENVNPPIARMLDLRFVEVRDGFAAFEVKPQEFHYNPTGGVHGGLAATVMDSALGYTILPSLPAGVTFSTIELHFNLVRGITKDTPTLRAEATVLHRGRTIRTAECKLLDGEGKLYAHGTTTCAVIPQ